jgi:hypothetical protein
LESSQYNPPSTSSHRHYQYPHRTLSPSNSRDIYMTSNTVPVYRHGRKFYVSAEEFERMRADERRQRRTVMQKSQNLPVSKSPQINVRSPSTSLYNPIHRSTSHPHDYRYGVLRTPHLPTNSIINNNNNNRNESIRPSRSTFRQYDDQDDLSLITSALPMKLSTTTVRSNSSDKVLDLRRTPQPSISSYSGYIPEDYELKRSFSAEMIQPPEPHPRVPPRRPVATTVSDYGIPTISSFPMTPTDQTYTQSNASKLTSYFTRLQPSTLDSQAKPSSSVFTGAGSTYEANMQDSDSVYSVLGSSNRHTGGGLPSALTRLSSNNSNNNNYYIRDNTSGSFSDDNSSSPSMLIQRRNTDINRYRRPELVVETDDDYGQQNEIWPRSTARSQSSDGLTEKKRVRFADMEGFTLETVPDIEQQQRSPMNTRLLTRRSDVTASNNLRGQLQPFHNSFYQATTRVGGNGSKLATDV